MKIKLRLIRYHNKICFQTSIISMLFNPFYLIRRGLFKGIAENSSYMKGVLLDFGCGSKPYEKLFNVEKYIGLDIEKSGHDHFDSKIDIIYDGENIPFDDNYFDSVFSSEVFEHLFNIDDILKEIYRVIKPGGNLLITVPFVWEEHEIPYDFGRYTSYGIKYLLEKNGFQIIKISKSTNYIETIFQMWNAYIFQYFLPKNPYVKLFFTLLFIAPITILGILFSKILPKNYYLFQNNIITARKV